MNELEFTDGTVKLEFELASKQEQQLFIDVICNDRYAYCLNKQEVQQLINYLLKILGDK